MLIEEFINTTENWEEVLAKEPYFVKTTWDRDYFILKYTQFASDFSNEIVQQCRGSIFYWKDGKAECVCRPFDKFFNVQEENAVAIDWDSAIVTEKVDGSLMKWWWFNGEWHLSTNGTIDAFKAPVGDGKLTFGDIFVRAAGEKRWQTLKDCCLGDCTYLFELTSPEIRVIIPYEDNIYYLTTIRNEDKHEFHHNPALFFDEPRCYPLSNLNDCLIVCNKMSVNEEGFVVQDKFNHRVKIKSPAYLAAHTLANNGAITTKRVLEMMQNETIDDFLALLPQFADKVANVKAQLKKLEMHLEITYYNCFWHYGKDLHEWLKNYPVARDFCYKRLKQHQLSAQEYIMKKQPSQIIKLLDGDK